MTKIAIIQKEIPHYRVRFFEEVSAQASTMGFDAIVYSAAKEFSENAFRFAQRSLPIHQFTRNKNGPFWMKGLTAALKGTDIIVAPQELQCLNVPYLWATRHRLCKSWIWWGHGYNFQASIRSSVSTHIKETLKRFMTRRANGVITYTAKGAEYWRQQGLPENRVIPYFNTIDVEDLRRVGAEVSEQRRAELKKLLKIEGKRVLLFSGRLYPEKKVDFLLRAFAILQESYPDVALLIIGDGSERSQLETLATELNVSDVHFLGKIVKPEDTAVYFSLAELLVIPGLVGLAIVHGFAYGLPMVTTQHDFHSPEIEYLTPENGLITPQNEQTYSDAIFNLLNFPTKLTAMREAAEEQGNHLHLDRSAERFLHAIVAFSTSQLHKGTSHSAEINHKILRP